jgi:cytochrome P450
MQVMRWIRQPIPLMQECAARYGDGFTLRFPGFPPLVFFSAPAAIKQIFTADPEELRAGEANVIIEPVVGRQSVLRLDGARHHRERRLLMPPFHGERMRLYGDVMRAIADEVIERWPIGRSFPIHPEMQHITLEVILRTVFGLDEGPRLTLMRDQLIRMIAFGAANPRLGIPFLQIDLGRLNAWGRFRQLIRDTDALLYEEFTRRRAASLEGREDILTLLLSARDEQGEPMTDGELRDEMITLLLAGHETSATTLAWVMHRLLNHPDVLARARAELRDVVGGGALAAEHVGRLEYLDATIKETMRLNPIIPAVGRRLAHPMRIGDRDLPGGVVVAPCIYLAHRRPDVWDDPERFAPERFLEKRPGPYEYFPFGGGPRHCLGAAFAMYEMKIVLAETLARVELRASPGYTVRVVRRGITFAPSEGVPVVVDRRAA